MGQGLRRPEVERGDFLGQRVGGVSVRWAWTRGCPELKPGDLLGGAIRGRGPGSGACPPGTRESGLWLGACPPGLGGVPKAGGVVLGATRWCSAD